MAKKRKQDPLTLAATVASNKMLAHLEGGARESYYIKKVFLRDGPEAAAKAIEELVRDGSDPSEASAQAFVSAQLASAWIDHHESMGGRKRGARAVETVYLEQLVNKYPHEPSADLYRMLRAIASNPGDKRNPTPGKCPFTFRYFDGKPQLFKRNKLYPASTFGTAISTIKQRLKAGPAA